MTTPTIFTTAVDIANRGLQHLGARRIASFTDDTVQASEMSFAYDKARVAELRRNVWRFAVRKAVLRPIDTSTQTYTPPAWNNGTTYAAGTIVSYQGTIWSSTIGSNLNNTPGVTGWQIYFGMLMVEPFDSKTAYYPGDIVSSSGVAYLSLISSNSDVPPTANWLTLTGTLASFSILYPIGAGPATQSATRNVYTLPNGYLREAPQDPKSGSTSFLGAPSGRMYDDWTFEGNYFTSREVQPIVFRFVADIYDVTQMDPMFCEGFAARLAMETCELITQSTAKLNAVTSAYNRFMTEARLVNGIEEAPTEPPEDDYITCRI